jgi:hypothetical protein
VTADLPEGLREAIQRVDMENPPPLTFETHPQALRALGEFYDQRDRLLREEAKSLARHRRITAAR